MRAIRTLILIIALMAAAAVGLARADFELQPGDTLLISQDHAWPPFAFVNRQGEPDGLLVDIWREAAAAGEFDVEFLLVDWPETIEQVVDGRAHVHGGLFQSPERERRLDFSVDLFPLSTYLFVSSGGTLANVEEVGDMAVGVISSSFELEFVSGQYPGLNLREYANNDEMILSALAGEISVFVADYPVAMYLLDRHGQPTAFRPMLLLYQRSLRAAVARGNSMLLASVDQAIGALDDEALRRMQQRWMRSEQVEVIPVWLIPSLVLGVIILVLVLYSVFQFRERRHLGREVARRTRQLSEQEQLFRTLFESAGAGIFMLRGDRFIAVNAELASMTGYSTNELLADDFVEIVHPDDREMVQQRARARQRGEPVTKRYEYRIVRSDGEVRWVELTADVTFTETGPVTIGTLYDLTTHRELQDRLRLSEMKFRSLVENANDIIYTLEADGTFGYVSPNWPEFLGHEVDAVHGHHFSEFVDSRDVNRMQKFLDEMVSTGKHREAIEYRVRHKDGSIRWFTANSSPLLDDAGEVMAYSGIARDITGQRAADSERRRQHEFRRLVAEVSTDFLNARSADLDSCINRNLRKISEFFDLDRAYIYLYSSDGLRMHNTHEWCAEGMRSLIAMEQDLEIAQFPWWFRQTSRQMHENQPVYINDVDQLPDEASVEREKFRGQDVGGLVTMPLRVGEETIGFIGFDSRRPRSWESELGPLLIVVANLVSDVLEKTRLEEELRRASRTDPLTGLHNRRHLLDQLNNAIDLSQSDGRSFALAMVDIDHFKPLNDTFGHLAGDRVLVEIATLIVKHLPGDDIAGRYGGEEFMLLLGDVDAVTARKTMDTLLDAIRNHVIHIEGRPQRITASAGLVMANELDAGITPGLLIRTADRRLYAAKDAGRDQLVFTD